MKEFIVIMKRFLPKYKGELVMSFIYNILSAIFSISSLVLMSPVLSILFKVQKPVVNLVEWEMSKDAIVHNFNYYMTSLMINYGQDTALLFIGLFMCFAVVLKVGAMFLGSYHMVGIRNGVVRDIRKQLYSKLISLPLPFFSEEKKGDIMSRITGDVQEVENSIMSSIDMFIKNPIIIIVSLVCMLYMSFQLTIFVLLLLPVAGYIIGGIGKSLKRTSTKGQSKMGDLLSIIEESLSGLRIIKAFNAENKINDKFDKENNEYRRIMNSLMRRRILAHPVSEFLGTLVIVIVLWYGGRLILRGEGDLSGAEFIVYLGAFYTIINPAKSFSKAMYSIQKGLAAMDRIDDILFAESTIREIENPKPLESFESTIEYKNVNFAYKKDLVLKNINLKIKKGQTVALVGQSGSGKTTFVDLLPRFYDTLNGSIFIDGVDVKSANISDLRDLMGNVNQESILFNDTIYNNIAFGVKGATMDKVIEAAKIANAHNFIIETEDSYNTNIGDRGGKLSGGQRQRLSIARAVLKNPPIMILDEATSALDTESEKLVQDALDNLMKNRTSLVIAHRLSTVKNADLICVFDKGQIIEVGSHKELIDNNGMYRKLYDMQVF